MRRSVAFAESQKDMNALRDLVPFAQFRKCEKQPWKSVTFIKAAGFKMQRY